MHLLVGVSSHPSRYWSLLGSYQREREREAADTHSFASLSQESQSLTVIYFHCIQQEKENTENRKERKLDTE